MKPKGEITLHIGRFRFRAIKMNKKAGCQLRKLEKELAKRKANLPKV